MRIDLRAHLEIVAVSDPDAVHDAALDVADALDDAGVADPAVSVEIASDGASAAITIELAATGRTFEAAKRRGVKALHGALRVVPGWSPSDAAAFGGPAGSAGDLDVVVPVAA